MSNKLTKEQIEEWRRVLKSFLQMNGVVTTEQTRIEINALCDMALSALEHTEQQRVVDSTSTPEPAYQDRGSVERDPDDIDMPTSGSMERKV